MKRVFPFLAAASLLAAGSVQSAELTVFAAASLNEALTEIGVDYERQSGVKVVFNFGASSMLARQIEQGAPADLFFSADEAKVNALEKNGMLLPGTRRNLLSNSLVIVVATGASAPLNSAADLVKPEWKKVAVAEPQTVPAGIYARGYFEKLGLWSALKEKIVPTDNVRAALAAVESGNVDAGIVYKTDALISKKVKVAAEISGEEAPGISYPLAVLKDSKQPERAKEFAEYLTSPAARAIFEKFGFIAAQ